MGFVMTLFTGCTATDAVLVPHMLWPEIMMGNEGMYSYYYFDKYSDVNHLAEKMVRGESEPYRLAVKGYLPDKTAKAILAAVEINKNKKLTKLKFTYVGSEEYKDSVQKAIENLGAKFYFYKDESKLLNKK